MKAMSFPFCEELPAPSAFASKSLPPGPTAWASSATATAAKWGESQRVGDLFVSALCTSAFPTQTSVISPRKKLVALTEG